MAKLDPDVETAQSLCRTAGSRASPAGRCRCAERGLASACAREMAMVAADRPRLDRMRAALRMAVDQPAVGSGNSAGNPAGAK